MYVWSDITAVQNYEMRYMNAWQKRCVFNLDINRESVSEPWTLSERLFQSLGAKYEKVLTSLESEWALLAMYVYTYEEFVIVTEAPQWNRMTATGRDTDCQGAWGER